MKNSTSHDHERIFTPFVGLSATNSLADKLSRSGGDSAEVLGLINEATRHLPGFTESGDWKSVSQVQILEGFTIGPGSNLYLTNLLLKAHSPGVLFEKVRLELAEHQYLAFSVSTAENIKNQVRERYPDLLFKIYYPFYFTGRRVLPKLKGFRKVSRLLGIPVDMSKAEIMGRLIYHGFEIAHMCESAEKTLFIARRQDSVAPSTYANPPKEGVLFSMQRMGKKNQLITVYKFRSMHPYAEYAQSYLHQTNGLDAGGKFKNDYRVSTGGRLIRKYWIDELPMLYNLLRGDIKLIGVRPISQHYFNLYPENLQTLRARHKPGLLPPFYADMPKEFEDIVQSELKYLEAYEKAPFKTDLAYLGKIIKNIFYHRVRSK